MADLSTHTENLFTPDDDGSLLAWLGRVFSLSSFDINVIVIALAPELDLRYERLFAYLADDITRKRPTVDLALNLLCRSADEKLAERQAFATDSPLITNKLIRLVSDPNQVESPLLSQSIYVDNQIVRFLLGQNDLDPRLVPFCRLIESNVAFEDLPLDDETKQALPALLKKARETYYPLRFYLRESRSNIARSCAEAMAAELGVPLLVVNLTHIPNTTIDFGDLLWLVFREAWFQGAILYLDDMDALKKNDRSGLYRRLLDLIAEFEGITIMRVDNQLNTAEYELSGVIDLSFQIPGFAQRRAYWQTKLNVLGVTLAANDLDALADRFRLGPGQIGEAIARAHHHALWCSSALEPESETGLSGKPITVADLFATCREQSFCDLGSLAQKVTPFYSWDDLVLPEDAVAQLQEICQRVEHRRHVLTTWGFHSKLSHGKGINALFAGPSGTGKTMSAEIVANEVGLDLYKVNLAGVVSKYIGETEKNLDRIFNAAQDVRAILLFDEADALLGKRSEVRDSHDRYANIEVAFLLQWMEKYEGVVILTTNLRSNLDEAFTRRLTFTVHFPFPDVAERLRIWQSIWPTETPLADDVDLNVFAEQFNLSGGNIKNIALASAYLAAETRSPITNAYLLQATKRELQKMGKVLSDSDVDALNKAFSHSLEQDHASEM